MKKDINDLVKQIAEHYGDEKDLVDRYRAYASADAEDALHRMKQRLGFTARQRSLRRWMATAAAAALLVAAGSMVWFRQYSKVVPPEISEQVLAAMQQSELTGRQEALVEMVSQNVHEMAVETESTALSPLEATRHDESDLTPIIPHLSNEEILLAARRITTHSDKEFWLTLSDGTLVHLNYNTRVIYPEKFIGDTRDVILEGEAYFMVAKDKRHPFIVHTGQGDIKVYGTEFNVSSRLEQTEVVLVEGCVGVTPTSGSEQIMRPGQKWSMVNGQWSMEDVDLEPYVAWNTGTFVFEDCPLSQLMDVLTKWYGCRVVFQSTEAWQKHFTGALDRYGSIKPALEAIASVTGLDIEIHNQQITIK